MGLDEYRGKRDFGVTPEPGGDGEEGGDGEGLRYVIHKHDATSLHYDFRLELDGTLKSWAVPKGPSLRAGVKRLAMQTEDHPMSYGDFEGVIPPGQYGGGTVMLWDRGRWVPEGDAREGYRRGRLRFRLEGEKLSGGWILTRMKEKPGEKKASWLLIKSRDDASRSEDEEEITAARPLSVATGRDLEGIAADSGTDSSSGGSGVEIEERDGELRVDGVRISSPDKVLWQGQGVTKRELVEYYVAVGDAVLPRMRDRPLTLVRCPSGAEEQCFYQKHAKDSIPDRVPRVAVDEEDGSEPYMYVDGLPALLSLVQLGTLEFHIWGSRRDRLERPDRLVFDLDPDEELPFGRVAAAALRLRDLLGELGLESWPKSSGGKGLHVVVPITRRNDWDETKAFTQGVARRLVTEDPDAFTANMSKSRRGGKIFLDYLRNARNATAIAEYSTRARPGAPVAVPLAWDEVNPRAKRPPVFTIRDVPARVAEGDPWAGFDEARQSITRAMKAAV
jgi:bifunctional non-homologous end joining protein LigD